MDDGVASVHIARWDPAERRLFEDGGESHGLGDLRPGTTVRMADGRKARITVNAPFGDPPSSVPRGGAKVRALSLRWTTRLVTLRFGHTRVTATPEHPFFVVGRGWVPARDLREGVSVITASAKPRALTHDAEEYEVAPTPVYNLEVDETHTYFVEGDALWVHNGTCASFPRDGGSRAEGILGKRLSENQGNTDGGFFKGFDGHTRYVKFYMNPGQAYGEHLANTLYRALGIAAPKSEVVRNGPRTLYSSLEVAGTRPVTPSGLTRAEARDYFRGWMADRLVQNEDLHMDNLLVTPKGRILRIDNGGSFAFTGMNGLRKVDDDDAILEHRRTWDRMREASGYSDGELKALAQGQVRSILELRSRHGGWAAYVDQHIPGARPSDRAEIAAILEANTQRLVTQFGGSPMPKRFLMASPRRLPEE